MKISSFNPLILTPNGDEIIKLFEELGFECRHQVNNVDGFDVTNTSMSDANGFHVDVANAPDVPRDITFIRMNVDDFDEAYEFMLAHGFTAPKGHTVDSPSSRSVMLVSPSGLTFDLCQHIKKD